MRTFSSFRSLLCLICLAASASLQAQDNGGRSFYFDYRIEYTYSTPTIPNGSIIALYNSLEKYVAFTQLSPYLGDSSILIGFADGSSILYTEERNGQQAVVKPATMPGRDLRSNKEDMDAAVFWSYVRPTGKTMDIAGYLANEYTGTLDDYSLRRVWVSEESFDARTLHTPFSGLDGKLPLPLLEASFIGGEQFLLGSEIQLENGQRYSLMLTYLEYELHMLDLSSAYWLTTGTGTELASKFNSAADRLREKKWEVWQQYERMGGLEYSPTTYPFDTRYIYEWTTDEDTRAQRLEVLFNTELGYAGFRSPAFDPAMDMLLGFKNGVMIAYFSDPVGRSPEEAIFIEPAGNQLHLDEPDVIRWGTEAFGQYWQKTGKKKTLAGLVCDEYGNLNYNPVTETLCLSRSSFDPRVMYMDYHEYIEHFPPCFSAGAYLPPNELITYWEAYLPELGKSRLVLKEVGPVREEFSDKLYPVFKRVRK